MHFISHEEWLQKSGYKHLLALYLQFRVSTTPWCTITGAILVSRRTTRSRAAFVFGPLALRAKLDRTPVFLRRKFEYELVVQHELEVPFCLCFNSQVAHYQRGDLVEH